VYFFVYEKYFTSTVFSSQKFFEKMPSGLATNRFESSDWLLLALATQNESFKFIIKPSQDLVTLRHVHLNGHVVLSKSAMGAGRAFL
jgi:hypothetical protein